MANTKSNYKGVIGVLTGGGDVPGLNPAIRAVTFRAIREGYKVIGIRKGWEGMITIDRSKKLEEQEDAVVLTEQMVNRLGRTGGTFLHSSRTRPDMVKLDRVPDLYKDKYTLDINDMTSEVMLNIDYLGLDYLIPIGGDDTLSYGVHLHSKGVPVVAIPKTMDNDVPGTDYCIGFGTCISRTIELAHELRTSAGSHERFLVIEVFGRYAGFSALLPTMAGAADRCVIPEHKFDIEHLTELMVQDRANNPSKYSVLLVSEGAMFKNGDMIFKGEEADAYGHKKLGGIGDIVSEQMRNISAKYNNGRKIDVINQRLGYMVRSGAPDALDSIVPMAFGNLALDLILKGTFGRLVSLRNGRYDNVPIEVVTSYKKKVDIEKFYDKERYRPRYENFNDKPQLIMTSDY
ncbi:6-phosphofructokinase [Acetobacteroides hydrogenigenes]|uniref:6-phosphofructokinase 1 n=1 Tax=Acetobacteroides hydrogenigenes TaxID=979970 RepID=A0A4R2EZB1_9BACT|nr:ATP-dependent 6-phosphofructokinase [Acetobacteroides hydrogenigenes]TCN70059.1 6-phosphofructokinase 1 [Acetobacteroides hydrogenigenes]